MSVTSEAVENALTEAFLDNSEMVTRWVLVAESIGEQGDRGVWMIAPSDQKAWDSLGLLEYARQREQSFGVVDLLQDQT